MSDRLEAIDALSGKGVHDVVSAPEAQALASHVYLLSAAILNLHERYRATASSRQAAALACSQVGPLPTETDVIGA